MSAQGMRSFWDARAREDPFFFVDDRLQYRDPDLDAFWEEGRTVVERILGELGVRLRPEDELVEIGCGVGRLTRALAAEARRVVAIDVSEQMVALARGHNEALANVEWVVGDGTSLAPVGDAAADACFSHVVFQHIPDPEVTLGYVREMGRVLRPGGWSAFQVSDDPSVHRPRRRGPLQRLLELAGRSPRGRARPEWLGSAVDLARLEAVAREAGMGVEKVVGRGTQFCLVLLRREP